MITASDSMLIHDSPHGQTMVDEPQKKDVHTPTQKRGSFMETDSTLAHESSGSTLLNTEQQFDVIATEVNRTIQELSNVYHLIGYSEQEISQKKGDIFHVIQDTITQFAQNLQREKNNIQNECEWLRQQIRIILAMLNDNSGEHTLKLSSRGIVFDDDTMLQEGQKEDMLHQMNNYHSQKHGSFYTNLPFNFADSLPSDDFSVQQQYEYMINHKAKLSLLQCKTRLNSIFLEVLKAFIKVFRKFNECTVVFWENVDAIGDSWPPTCNSALLNSLPSRAESEEQARLIDDFDDAIRSLKLTSRNYKPEACVGISGAKTDDEFAFIISSPRKHRIGNEEEQKDTPSLDIDNGMDRLRDVNYKIVRVIRSLRITKITPEVVLNLRKEIEWTEEEITRRNQNMKDIVGKCLQYIDALSLTEEDVISIQKMQDMSEDKEKKDWYFDIETLRFVETNPREFGLMDHHIKFVTKLANTLKSLRDAKQKKWDYYSNACVLLWEKLGESREYIQQFLDANSSLTDMCLANLKMELNRLYIKRSEFIESFIVNVRKEIASLQQALLYSEEQCKEFKYHDYDVNDEHDDKELVLNEHEAEVEKLKKEYATKEPVLGLYAQLNELLQDQKFLIESSKDSSRLLSKNSCKILLNEEKIRKRIIKGMPRVIENLKQEIIKYNNLQLSEGKRPISVGNCDLFEKVLVIESEHSNQGPSKLSARARVLKPATRSVSPAKNSRAFGSTRPSPVKARSPARVTKEPKGSISPLASQRRIASGNFSPVVAAGRQLKGQSTILEKKPKFSAGAKYNDLFNSSPKLQKLEGSSFTKFGGTHLQPLNSPLCSTSSICSEASENKADSRGDSTLYSICSRVSPLRNANLSNIAITTKFSPVKGYELADMSDSEKENGKLLDAKLGLSPIRVVSTANKSTRTESNRLSTNSLANSTIIGDEYQFWREEKIREINRRF